MPPSPPRLSPLCRPVAVSVPPSHRRHRPHRRRRRRPSLAPHLRRRRRRHIAVAVAAAPPVSLKRTTADTASYQGDRGDPGRHTQRAHAACGAETIPALRVDTLLCILEHSPLVSFQALLHREGLKAGRVIRVARATIRKRFVPVVAEGSGGCPRRHPAEQTVRTTFSLGTAYRASLAGLCCVGLLLVIGTAYRASLPLPVCCCKLE